MTAFSNEFLQDLPPKERRYDTPVAENLVFSVFPNGVKAWVHVYSYEGFVRRRTIGLFPEMDYAQAQAALSQSRRIVAVELQQGGQRRQHAGMSRGKLLLLVSGAVGGGVVVALMIRMLTADGPVPGPESSTDAVPAEPEQTLAVTMPTGAEAEPTEIQGTIPDSFQEAPQDEAPQAAPEPGESGPVTAAEEPEADTGAPPADQDDVPPETPGAETPEAAPENETQAPETQMAEQAAADDAGEEETPGEVGASVDTGAVASVAPEGAMDPARDEAEEIPGPDAGERPVAEAPAADDGPPLEEQESPAEPDLAAVTETPSADSGSDDETAAEGGEPAEVIPTGADPAVAPSPMEDGPAAGDPDDGTGETTAAEPPAETSVRTQLTSGLADMEPTDELDSPIVVAAGGTRRVYFFTEARGLFGSRVTHRWQFEGTTLTQLPFVVAGDPWPVYSSKDIPADQAGDWEVSIVGEDGTVLASESFQVSVEAP